MPIPNSTFRAFVEKLGDVDPGLFVGNEGDLFYNPNTASLRISDGVTPGGIPVTGVSTISGPINFSLIPDADATYDIGAPSLQWRDLYVANQSIYMGGVSMQIVDTDPAILAQPTGVAHTAHMTVDGSPIPFMDEVADMVLASAQAVGLKVNTDPSVYQDEDKPEVNPNGTGGWYYTNPGPPHKINWHVFTKSANDRFSATLAQWQGSYMEFTPWSVNTEYPFIQIYTLPKIGGGNAASWYRSRITYAAPNTTHIPGSSRVLYWGEEPDALGNLPRTEMVLDPFTTVGPQDPDEVPFAIVINTNSGAAAGAYDFSTDTVGYKVADINLKVLLYALPTPAGPSAITNLIPTADDTYTVGTTTSRWNNVVTNNLDVGGTISSISSNLIPSQDEVFDLGSATNKWRDLYISSNSINIGDQVISAGSTALFYNGEPILDRPGLDGILTGRRFGYELTGGFVDRDVIVEGTGFNYSQQLADSKTWKRFGFSTVRQAANDVEYWGETDPAFDQTKGLFGGLYLPQGSSGLFDYTDTSVGAAVTTGNLKYTAADGSYDFTGLSPGDYVEVRFSFNVTPQEANTTLEVGLIWSTRDANDNVTFTFPLTTQPIYYGVGSVGVERLNRVTMSAYFASPEDVNARALPAIRADNQIIIQPLSTLAIVYRR